eukprot:10221746-Alexandrium_andersonii.AAC.1
MKIEDACSQRVAIDTAIVAGCACATRMLKALLVSACDSLQQVYLRVMLYVYVDDITLSVVGSQWQ